MEIRYCPVCASALVTRADDQDAQKTRLSCPEGHWTHWDNPLPVLAALVEYDGKILLARNAAWPEKTFALITGFMERDETPEQGITREIKEETNLEADAISLIGVYEFVKKNEVIIAYHVVATGDIRLSEELLEYRLIEPEKLRPWNAGTGHAMADWMRSRGYQPVYYEWPTG